MSPYFLGLVGDYIFRMPRLFCQLPLSTILTFTTLTIGDLQREIVKLGTYPDFVTHHQKCFLNGKFH
jgi:hypothetical protein